MVCIQSKTLALITLIVSFISIALGAFFIAQGFNKANLITKTMVAQNITYGSADGTIEGIIDTPQEAAAMAAILEEHRAALGSYTSLQRDDPNRQTILNAMTMENSLTMAQMGYGLTQVVEGTGVFMVIIGLTIGAGGVMVMRNRQAKVSG
jgi:hypothetical protein